VSGGEEGKIRRWRIGDGKEVGTAMDAESGVLSIAVSRDGKVIVGGTRVGWVTVWNAESHSKVSEFEAHDDWVRAVDVSPDATKIVTGSSDNTACVWSLSTGERLLGPLKHNYWVVGARFSPDGRLVATTTRDRDSVRVYDSRDGSFLVEFPVKVSSTLTGQNYWQSLAWASDSKQLFVLSHDGFIHHADVSAKTIPLKWKIHSGDNYGCIALASNGTFVAASASTSVSFWDTATQEQIAGTIIYYTHGIGSMAMSSKYDLVASGGERITFRGLCGILPSRYLDDVSVPA